MDSRAILICVLLALSFSFSGCFGSENEKSTKEETNSFWQEKSNNCTPDSEQYYCETYLEGFVTPIKTVPYYSTNEIWIGDLSGEISAWNGENLRLVGDLSDLVSNCHNEQGMLSFAFIEELDKQTKVMLSYTENTTCESEQSNLILAQIDIVNHTLNLDSLSVLRTIYQPHQNHNGGHILALGNNHYLWGIGDGGSRDDPYGNGQNSSTPLGTMQYFQYQNSSIKPLLNHSEDDDENFVLHTGLRNPWRFDVDPNGRLWIADVGQRCWEEVNMVEMTKPSNFGWSTREGKHIFEPESGCNENITAPPEGFVDPVIEYNHSNGNCSISGGEWMDWGPESVRGGYIFGDFCSGNIWTSSYDGENWFAKPITNVDTLIVGFGRGLNDELLIFSWAGTIYQLDEI